MNISDEWQTQRLRALLRVFALATISTPLAAVGWRVLWAGINFVLSKAADVQVPPDVYWPLGAVGLAACLLEFYEHQRAALGRLPRRW